MGHNPKDWRVYRKTRAPRVLLVATWADARWGFPGGGIKPKETPAEALTREFLEETGAEEVFLDADFMFAQGTIAAAPPPPAAEGVCGGSAPLGAAAGMQTHPLSSLTYFFCKTTSDLAQFEAALGAFSAAKGRTNEIYATCGMPLCYESPAPSETSTKPSSDLPKNLAFEGGAFVSSHGGVVRENLLLALLCIGVLDEPALGRLLDLASRNTQYGQPLPSASAFLAMPGVAELLAARRSQGGR